MCKVQDADVVHTEDRVDPVEDLEIIHHELRLKDIERMQVSSSAHISRTYALNSALQSLCIPAPQRRTCRSARHSAGPHGQTCNMASKDVCNCALCSRT